ncbi:hypothetical protein LguiA_000230 [Lonicera macranthoides]
MAIVASLPGLKLFSSLPTNPPPNEPTSSNHPPHPPIPIPKYPSPRKKQPPLKPNPNPAFKTFHHRSKYYKPVRDGVVSSDGDRSVVVGESGVSYRLPGAPFEFQFSYSETPKAKPVAIREPAFLPFAPPTMPRPWTGKAPMKKAKRNIPLFDSFNSPPTDDSQGVKKYLEMPAPYKLGYYQPELKPREEVLGKPLTRLEIRQLLKPHISSNRQVNLGRDGLTHNMLELIHSHWRRDPICKVRCLGVPTVDMNNVCRCLEEKTGGKIIHRVGGTAYLFRGRNYDHRTRPQYPVMLWKPATPVYPKLIQEAPEGLTKAEADELRRKGKNLPPICKLAKNGVYNTLVRDVRSAFEECQLAKINCTGMHASDYKRIGAKLKELVPCVLLSFDEEQILMWRGHEWKSMYRCIPPTSSSPNVGFQKSEDPRAVSSSPKMMSLWKNAIESSKALVLDEIGLSPNELLEKVEEFERVSQAAVHSYPALILSGETADDQEGPQDENYNSSDYDDESYLNESFVGDDDSSLPMGTLTVDLIAKQLSDNEK